MRFGPQSKMSIDQQDAMARLTMELDLLSKAPIEDGLLIRLARLALDSNPQTRRQVPMVDVEWQEPMARLGWTTVDKSGGDK